METKLLLPVLSQVSTGVTLRENNLKEIEGGHIMDSEGILVGNAAALKENPGLQTVVHELIERLEVFSSSTVASASHLPPQGLPMDSQAILALFETVYMSMAAAFVSPGKASETVVSSGKGLGLHAGTPEG